PGDRADPVRRVGEPELVPLPHPQPLGVVEDRGVLPGAAAVAAEADHLVAGQRLAERGQLAEQRLLDAQQCGLLLLEQLDQVRPTVGPVVGIARRGGVRAGEAEVERHHVQLVGRRRADQGPTGGGRGHRWLSWGSAAVLAVEPRARRGIGARAAHGSPAPRSAHAVARRRRAPSASARSTDSLVDQSMHASVTDRPRTRPAGPASTSSLCAPPSRLLSSITPATAAPSAAICSASMVATSAWRTWSLPELPWLASMTRRGGRP